MIKWYIYYERVVAVFTEKSKLKALRDTMIFLFFFPRPNHVIQIDYHFNYIILSFYSLEIKSSSQIIFHLATESLVRF